jgi:coatomer subunit beta'
VCIATEESFYILKYDADAVSEAMAGEEEIDEDEGIEEAFDVVGEIEEVVATSHWVGDVFIYTNKANRLNYHVGGEIVTIAHLDRPMYLMGYLSATSRLYLCDKDVVIVSYLLHQSVLEYQTAVMRGDLEHADQCLEGVPMNQRTRVAHFLEKQGFKEQALVVSVDNEHRFELAIGLGRLAGDNSFDHRS